jgi:N-terminal domain of galactosyltransferase/Glycosyl transferase family 2
LPKIPRLRWPVISRRSNGRGISLLVPFSPGLSADRDRIWTWAREYWRHHLAGAQIVMGHDPQHKLAQAGHPFSKTSAVNAAAHHARGDILVILDADAYVHPSIVLDAAREIRHARATGRKLWYVPYRHFYRLSPDATERVLTSDPRDPWHPSTPPPPEDVDPTVHASSSYGHHFMAMIAIMPREAFEATGGMDPRFAGWGGEDVSYMRCVDTIYSPHKTLDRSVFHLFHGTFGVGINREWEGQDKRKPFAVLGSRYAQAYGDRARMLRLTNEWRQAPPEHVPTTNIPGEDP